MRYIFRHLLFAGILLTLPASHADQHDLETSPETDTEDQQQPAAAAEKTGERSSDTFVPTETISEDLSVPFPVDI